MKNSHVGFINGEQKQYTSGPMLSMGVGFDWSQRRPILRPWGGAAPCTVFMYDPGGALGLPTTLTAQPGGWNLIAFTTWASFSASRSQFVSGRGDWFVFPGGTTITPDATNPNFWNTIGLGSGKNATYPTTMGTYDASSLTNAKNSTLFNTKQCTVDYTAITIPSNFMVLSATLPSTLNYLAFCNITLYAPAANNQLQNGFNVLAAGTNILFDRIVSYGGPVITYNPYRQFYANTLPVGGVTASGTTVTIADTATANFNIATAVNGGVTTINISGATPVAYNGTFTMTFVNSTTVQYTALSAPGTSPATGTVQWTAPYATIPDSQLLLNIVFNQCGLGYCSGYGGNPAGTGSRIQDLFVQNARNIWKYACVHMHGGWGPQAVRTPALSTPSSITSTGTVATINLTGIGTLVTGGTNKWTVQGASPLAFNGVYTLTASGANAATYTFAGAANASASPVGTCFPQNGSAAVGSWAAVATTAVSSLTQVAGLATALTTNTGSLATGSWVLIYGSTLSQWNFITQVFNVVANTSFQFNTNTSLTTPAPTSSGITWSDAASAGWVPTQGDPANIFNHSNYFSDDTDNINIFDSVVMWEAVNMKFTGGAYNINNLVEIRNPSGPIFSSIGNDTTLATWPTNATATLTHHLQIETDDMTYVTAGYRGWGPTINQKLPFTYRRGVLINQDNQSTSNREGIQVTNGVLTKASSVNMSDCISGFVPSVVSGTNVTTNFKNNIMTDTAGVISTMNGAGSGNIALSSTPSAFQTAMTKTNALNIYTTFRQATPELSGVAVGATNLLTEQNVGNHMMLNPWEAIWGRRVYSHYTQFAGF